ncbi:hypothetical protein BD324DRAFT_612087 [Kockovaella imperatae]|uniref:SWR1-complex protein 4 n=1 Tax=Kockovaella imperatae TaxID=4999 RepID=A0A1Y1URW2_9TREE|nr:hypothetical protein BD324DRAFT_612087 [Kockovaella imperatae]ORX40780.1 hypothetical protein BD324DRAFT_612087 [Kockovaella imperatae]
MSSSDVRSILGLPQAGSSSSHAPIPKKLNLNKRPDGISRELYALIGNNAPSLAEAQASVSAVKYKSRPSVSRKKAKWEWLPFNPAARPDRRARLSHWVQTSDADPEAGVEYFGKFNLHGPSVIEYSQFEYDQHLADPDWTPHETTYLFNLLNDYDLRFVIAADRYEYMGPSGEGPVKKRSIEDIKDRYYTICRRLTRTRTATDTASQQQMIQAYSFDKAREIKRKQYASELFHLTTAEIAEEEALIIEVKRMEQTAQRYRSDRDDLMRTVMGLDSGLVNIDSSNIEAILGANKKRKRAEEAEPSTPVAAAPTKRQAESTAFDAAHCIFRLPQDSSSQSSHLATKHPVHIPAFLRSSKLPTPRQSAAIRITELLGELGVSTHALVMPTRANLEEYDGLLTAAGALVDMKRQVDRVEQELRTLRAQKESYVPPVDAKRKARSTSIASTDTSVTGRRSRAP